MKSDDKNPHNQYGDHKIEGHSYDGIEELNNPLPGWWLATFYITIIFAVFYYAYYELGSGPTQTQELQQQLANLDTLKAQANSGAGAFPNADKLASFANDGGHKKGQGVFDTRCASCHGKNLEGGIGPNLTDAVWIHGDGSAATVAKTIHAGVAEKGMPPWGPVLSEDEIYAVTQYIKSKGK